MTATKRCTKCGSNKDRSDFHRQTSTRDGLHPWCKPCNIAAVGLWQKAHPERHALLARKTQLSQYGVTPAEYDALLTAQGGTCALCPRTPADEGRAMPVDHCHETGAIRGILCGPCNRAIGILGDTPEAIERVLTYVKGKAS